MSRLPDHVAGSVLLTQKGRRLLDEIAELLTTVRDRHDAFVLVYAEVSRNAARRLPVAAADPWLARIVHESRDESTVGPVSVSALV